MIRITRDDIQRIGDEGTLLHFLQEKLNLPIPEGATLAQIALPLPLPFLGLDDSIAEQIIDCQDFSGFPKNSLGERRPFLIRFKRASGYSEILRKVAESLHQKGTNPVELFFICADESFQPSAFAYFNDSASGNWRDANLIIFAWTQDNTYIHTSAEHELSANFFPSKSKIRPVTPTSPKALLARLENTGTPLAEHGEIHRGIDTGCNEAFVIDQSTRQQLINKDSRSVELVKLKIGKPQKNRWKPELKYLIWIPSSKFKNWTWSREKSEAEAERIFAAEYPAISNHIHGFKDKIKAKAAIDQRNFYWELPWYVNHIEYPKFHGPKIIFYDHPSMRLAAWYDQSHAYVVNSHVFSIPTADFSLLAILNSKLFGWYAQAKSKKEGKWNINEKNMKNFPIADRMEAQSSEISHIVQQILYAPNSPSVPALEEEINMLVYDLYDLTAAEIALIEKGNNP